MADSGKVITGLSHCKNHDGKDCPDCSYFNVECIDDLCADALDLIKELLEEQKRLKESLEMAKNVAERYANLVADKGVNDVYVLYAVKKRKQFMLGYQNKKASWCYGLDGAWMTHDRKMAEGFAKLTKGRLIEVTLTERPL